LQRRGGYSENDCDCKDSATYIKVTSNLPFVVSLLL
jgi:hypothetical protein